MTIEELRHTLRLETPERQPRRTLRLEASTPRGARRGPDDDRPSPDQIARDDDLLTTPTAGAFPSVGYELEPGLSCRAAIVGLLGVLERLSGERLSEGTEPPRSRARAPPSVDAACRESS